VGIVLDGTSAFTDSVRAEFEREIGSFFGQDTAVEFPPEHRQTGDWTPAGVAARIDDLLADSAVDLVLALGPVSSNELARRRELRKPAVAALPVRSGSATPATIACGATLG
jgi:hypothetical protein